MVRYVWLNRAGIRSDRRRCDETPATRSGGTIAQYIFTMAHFFVSCLMVAGAMGFFTLGEGARRKHRNRA